MNDIWQMSNSQSFHYFPVIPVKTGIQTLDSASSNVTPCLTRGRNDRKNNVAHYFLCHSLIFYCRPAFFLVIPAKAQNPDIKIQNPYSRFRVKHGMTERIMSPHNFYCHPAFFPVIPVKTGIQTL